MSADQWAEISDFSPGIFGDIHGGVVNTSRGALLGKNGAAVIDGTWRCCVDAFGALQPLPVATPDTSVPLIPAGNANATSAFYPSSMIGAFLVDAVTIGPYSTTFSWPVALKSLDGQVVHATCWFFLYAPAGGGTAYRAMYLCRLYWNGGLNSKDIMWESSYPVTYASAGFVQHQIGALSVTPHRTGSFILADVVQNPHSGLTVSVGGDVPHASIAGAIPADEQALTTWPNDMFDRLGAPRNTYPGVNVDITAVGSADNGYWVHWPRLTDGGGTVPRNHFRDFTEVPFTATEAPQTSTGQYGSSVRPVQVVSHQGRIVAIIHRLKGMSDIHRIQTSYLMYTPAFNIGFSVFSNATFYGENNSDVMVAASMNTDELLLIRNSDGGLLIRGDVDNPTIVRLRNLEPMYGVTMTPINTPNGLVYGTPNGVFVYQGGEVAPKISEQLEGFFWDHRVTGDPDYEANRGRFGHFNRFVAVPNNFLYDERAKSWWRLANPADHGGIAYNCYSSDPTSGNLYAFPYKLTQTQNTVCDRYTKEFLASSYSWRSQPLVETLEQVKSFEKVMLVASPGANTNACRVVVTLTGFDADGTQLEPVPIAFDFTGNGTGQPVIQWKAIPGTFKAMYVQVLIEASSQYVAPKVYSVRIGHGDHASLNRAG